MVINKEELQKYFSGTITDIKIDISESAVAKINVFTTTRNNPYIIYYHKSQIENLNEYNS